MKIDYLHGRKVESVTGPAANDTWDWSIGLEGGALIRNRDKEILAPPTDEICNNALLSSTVDEDADTVMLVFGTMVADDFIPSIANENVIQMTWSKMAISVPGIEGEIEPSVVPSPDDTLPPDPSSERVVEGPGTHVEAP